MKKKAKNVKSDHENVNVECTNVSLGDSLECRVKSEDAFAKLLINTIPPNIYFHSETLANVHKEKQKITQDYLDGKKRKGEISEKTKQKRAKLMPGQLSTVTQIQEELALAQNSEQSSTKVKVNSNQNDRSSSIEELRERLSAKIAKLKTARKCDVAEYKEKRKLKRQMSKLKLKEKRKAAKQVDVPVRKAKTKSPKNAASGNKPVFNKDGHMVFSKFDFAESGVPERKKGNYSGKDYKRLVAKVEKQQEKIQKLESKDEEKAKNMKEKNKWMTALQRAEGVKVKDDLNLLKKAAKRKENRKKKSSREWNKREEKVAKDKEDRQRKRKENIQARKKEKLKGKLKRASKKGRLIPGF